MNASRKITACRRPQELPFAGLGFLALLLCLTGGSSTAQSYRVLHEFTATDGEYPTGGLVSDGATLYGTTIGGGVPDGVGTVFKIDTSGSGYANITASTVPLVGLSGALLLDEATLYGVAVGPYEGSGGVFSTTTDGSEYRALKIFPDDGWYGKRPIGGLVLSGTTLYGVTAEGGFTSYDHPEGCGTVFKINTDGMGFSVLWRLNSDGAGRNGYWPGGALTLLGTKLYGTTRSGGESGGGTVFELNTDGTGYKVLKHFGVNEGAAPETRLVLSDSTLYGTTLGTVFQLRTDGTDFKVLKRVTPSDGQGLLVDLVLRGKTLYGAAASGGDFNYGTVFQLNTDGSGFAVLKHFMGTDGITPSGAFVLVKNTLYGTTFQGGSSDRGVVYSLSVPLLLLNPACVGTNFTFSFQSETGENYTVEYSDDLGAANWLFHHTVTGDGSLISSCIPRTNDAPRFFRLRLP